ncbi:MAG: alpha-glucan family phosphorylase [Candidatus Berkelbacteria bacterium]|nr:alpha-glucan family phosphorylase [Candidatus Berkelbacteria bacterium]
MSQHDIWFENFRKSKTQALFERNPVAYFCTEFGINNQFPIAGGLGVLAGDIVKEAFDQKFPMVGVGLFYYHGYKSAVTDNHQTLSPEQMGLKPAIGSDGERIKIAVSVNSKEVVVKGWVYDSETVPVYFLDTNVEENEPEYSRISDYLYSGDQDVRIMQEIILGIGGVKFLEAAGYQPSIYHMNDSYGAFLAYQVAQNIAKNEKIEFRNAMQKAVRQIAYTNHTLVAVGNDAFPVELVETHLNNYARQNGLNLQDLILYGHVPGEKSFSMTLLALKSSGATNCVSQLHSREAKELWPEFKIGAVTNGIHLKTWDKIGPGKNAFEAHQKNKQILLDRINSQTGGKWEQNELVLCWAKRIVSYKRPLALFEKIRELVPIVNNPNQPLRIIIAGVPHHADSAGIQMVNEIKRLAGAELREHLVYIDNYSLDVAKHLVSGADVWLNTPMVGWEACGTSTMKAALNGTLLISTKDGWLAEVGLEKIGWTLSSENIGDDIIETLKNKVVPLYYNSGRGKPSDEWFKKMDSARVLVSDEFSASRMLKEYIEKLYLRSFGP